MICYIITLYNKCQIHQLFNNFKYREVQIGVKKKKKNISLALPSSMN